MRDSCRQIRWPENVCASYRRRMGWRETHDDRINPPADKWHLHRATARHLSELCALDASQLVRPFAWTAAIQTAALPFVCRRGRLGLVILLVRSPPGESC